MHNPPLVLIADDEPETVELLELICLREGYRIEVANNGLEALEATRRVSPDLILLDIQMPRMDGLSVVRELRADDATQQIPVIIISAAATQPEEAAHGIELGADDYIYKPFNYIELRARMRAKIRTRELEERLAQRTEELEMLVRLGDSLNRSYTIEQLGTTLLEFLAKEICADHYLLHLLPYQESETSIQFAYADQKLETIKTQHSQSTDFIPGHTTDAEVIKSVFGESPIETMVRFPLMEDTVPFGVLAIGAKQSQTFTSDITRILEAIASHVALGIRNAYLYESLQDYANVLEDKVAERTRELEKAQEIVIRSEKLASMGRLASSISHEVNNPLQSIMITLQELIEDVSDNLPIDAEGLNIALSETERLKRLVQQVVRFARPDSEGLQACDLNALVENVLTLTKKKLEHTDVTVTTQLGKIAHIHANPDQIRQVLLNLVINAADAIQPKNGGTLTITTDQTEQVARIHVKDTGIGMSPEHIAHIFDPFYTTKEEGTGLGLAITYSIIEAHGGEIRVESVLGEGTEFVIQFPIYSGN